jgi:hypothetical protein
MDDITSNTNKSNEIIDYLSKKYPLFNQLNNDESKLFYKKAVAYYFHPKTK